MSFFRFSASAVETPVKGEMTERLSEIDRRITPALQYVGSEMAESLQKHIEYDWYRAYTPKEYPRRTDGASPQDLSIMNEKQNVFYHAEAHKLQFSYNVRGMHEESQWYKRDGDKLIESIQTGKLAGKPPARPFWNYFVREAEDGLIMDAFAKGMMPYKVEYDPYEADLYDESILAQDYGHPTPYRAYQSGGFDDELPF